MYAKNYSIGSTCRFEECPWNEVATRSGTKLCDRRFHQTIGAPVCDQLSSNWKSPLHMYRGARTTPVAVSAGIGPPRPDSTVRTIEPDLQFQCYSFGLQCT